MSYTVQFSAGSTGATGLPSTKYKEHGVGLVLPSTKPTKASTTSGNTRTDYTFAYWEGTPISGNDTTSTKTEHSQTYTWPVCSAWLTNAKDGISFQPKVVVTAYRGSSLRVKITQYMVHTYGDCISSGFWYSTNGGSSWSECTESSSVGWAVHYQGTYTTCEWDYTWPSVNQSGYITFRISPYRWQPYNYGTVTSTRQCTELYYNNNTYMDCAEMDFKIVWNSSGVEVQPACTQADNTSYSKKQYPAGSIYDTDAPITLYPVFTETGVSLSTDKAIVYNKNTTDNVYNMPTTQIKKQNQDIILSISTIPVRYTYIFTGWFLDTSCTKKVTTETYSTNASLVLYAGWRKRDYTITFNANGYTNVKNIPDTVYKTAKIDLKLPTMTPTKSDVRDGAYKYSYKFSHWEASQTNTSTTYKTVTNTNVPTESTKTIDYVTKDWGAIPQWWLYNSELGITVQPKITVTAQRTSATNVQLTFDFIMIHTYGDCVGSGFWYSTNGGSTWSENNPSSTVGVHYVGSTTTLQSVVNVTTNASGYIDVVVQPDTWYYSSNQPTSNLYQYNGYNYYLFDKVYIKVPYTQNYVECKTPTASYVSSTPVTTTSTTAKTTTTTTTATYKPGDLYKVDQSTNMFAVFKETKTCVETYAVTYNANGGKGAPASQTKTYGINLTLSSTKPTKDDAWESTTKYSYAFSSWNTAKAGNGTGYLAGSTYVDNAALTLYAQWSKTNITPYTITYNANGGTDAPDDQTKIHNITIQLSNNTPTRGDGWEGDIKYRYTFKNWNTKADGSGTEYSTNANYTANTSVTLYAQWDKTNITPYTITYDANTGINAPEAQTKIHNVDITLSGDRPTKADGWEGNVKYKYTFSKWNTQANGSGDDYSPGSVYKLNSSTTLYAQWSKTNITPYTVTFNAGGPGAKVNTTSVTHIHNVPTSTSGIRGTAKNTTKNYSVVFSVYGYLTSGNSIAYTSESPDQNQTLTFTDTYKWKQTEWNTEPDGTGTSFPLDFTIKFNHDETLYAIYGVDSIQYGSINTYNNFKIDNKLEDGFNVTCIPRCTGAQTQVLTAVDTISYTLTKWQQMQKSGSSYIKVTNVTRDLGISIGSRTSNMHWEVVTKTSGAPTTVMNGNSTESYRSFLKPIWTRKVEIYGTVQLPKLYNIVTDHYGEAYKMCTWTNVTTCKDGFTKIQLFQNETVYGVWELTLANTEKIKSDYLYSAEVLRSWYRLLNEIATQVTCDATPIPVVRPEFIPTNPYPEGYDGMIKSTDISTLVGKMQDLINDGKDAQDRQWFDGLPQLPIEKIPVSDYDPGKPVTKDIRDRMNDSIVLMRKWVKIY